MIGVHDDKVILGHLALCFSISLHKTLLFIMHIVFFFIKWESFLLAQVISRDLQQSLSSKVC